MVVNPFAPRLAVLYVFILSALFVHFRGRARFNPLRQLLSYLTLFAPINVLIYLFSAVPNRPFQDLARFPELEKLRENWKLLRDEALALCGEGRIRAAAGYNDVGFNSFFRTGWKRFYLKWYDDPLPSARALCPGTVALLQAIPNIHGAMFALLPPGGKLVAHRDPYAGSLRYHLGLVTPNSSSCRIFVDSQEYFWKDGEGVLFDETFIHYAENKSDVTRLILFCDVERPMRNRPMTAFNRMIANTLVRASRTQNVPGEPVGFLNRIFGYVYRIRLLGKRLKAWNRRVYYIAKYALIGAVLFWIFA